MSENRIKKKIFLSVKCFIIILGVLVFTYAAVKDGRSNKITNESGIESEISITVAVLQDTSPTVLVFILRNNGKSDYETTPIATNNNRIVIVTPGGEKIEHFFWKDGIKPIIVKPSTSEMWKVDISNILKFHNIKKSGTYHIYWKVNEWESPGILLFKEKDE